MTKTNMMDSQIRKVEARSLCQVLWALMTRIYTRIPLVQGNNFFSSINNSKNSMKVQAISSISKKSTLYPE